MKQFYKLPRGIIRLTGADIKKFLQGIITNDVEKLSVENPIYALILTPQGKFLYDLFLYEEYGQIWLDVAANFTEEIKKKLMMYKLRADVVIEDFSINYSVLFIFPALDKLMDPRGKFASRALFENSKIEGFCRENQLTLASMSEYESYRIKNVIPEMGTELITDKIFPLQNNMEKLHAIDFNKGCYVGQEVTARSKYRGTVKRNLEFYEEKTGKNLTVGEKIILPDGREAEVSSALTNIAIVRVGSNS